MLHACVQKFDVSGTVQKILGTKQANGRSDSHDRVFFNIKGITGHEHSQVNAYNQKETRLATKLEIYMST